MYTQYLFAFLIIGFVMFFFFLIKDLITRNGFKQAFVCLIIAVIALVLLYASGKV